MSTKSTKSVTSPAAEEPVAAAVAPTTATTEPTTVEPTKTPTKLSEITKESFHNLSSQDLALIIIAIFFPFITMGFKKGWCTFYVLVCLICEILVVLHLPVVLWAIYIVLVTPDTTVKDVEKSAGAGSPAAAPANPAIITSESVLEHEVAVEVKESSPVPETK